MSRGIRLIGVSLAFALLLFGTVLVFQAFDRTSHSASDTLRPFIITMFPVWLVAIAGAWALLRTPSPASDA
jgi:lipopolysaccharide export LptBFGC system permease protein LptF